VIRESSNLLFHGSFYIGGEKGEAFAPVFAALYRRAVISARQAGCDFAFIAVFSDWKNNGNTPEIET
jgi:hypothetical protein